jgi:hypothetical protein
MKFWHQAEALGLERLADKELGDFIFEFQTTSVKLGGALDGIAQGYECRDAAFAVAYLKRALGHLHKAQAGLEAVAPKNLLPNEMIAEAREELFAIRGGILELMNQFRGQANH